jgi:hypothetical protein
MAFRLVAVIVTNCIVFVATAVALRVWVMALAGYVDPDLIGGSMDLWALCAFVAVLGVVGAPTRRSARVVAVSSLAVMVIVVIEQALGAVRDGTVSAPGAVAGGLMALQCATVATGLAVATRHPARVARHGVGALVAVAGIVLVIGMVSAARTSGPRPREHVVAEWLGALAGGEADRGWRYLDGLTQSRTTRDAYVTDAREVDWSRFGWHVGAVSNSEGGWRAEIIVDGGIDSVPPFFFEHRLVHPLCGDEPGTGIGVVVEVPLIGHPTLGPGAMTGTAERGQCH